jgi:hypothetical protein
MVTVMEAEGLAELGLWEDAWDAPGPLGRSEDRSGSAARLEQRGQIGMIDDIAARTRQGVSIAALMKLFAFSMPPVRQASTAR